MARERKYMPEQISDTRTRWVLLGTTSVVLYESEEPDDAGHFAGYPSVRLVFSRNRERLSLLLTHYTAEEIRMLREFVNHALDLAEPLCEERDRIAREAFENNDDDTYIRLYRPTPQLHVRKRRQPQHGARVPGGPDFPAEVLAEADPDDDPGA